jgi:hypothetical protein
MRQTPAAHRDERITVHVFRHRDDEADLRSESDLVADRDVLPLRYDAICAVDLAADNVFEDARLPGRTLAVTVVSWFYSVIPVIAYMSVAILFSVATRNGILGVSGPLLVALTTQLLQLIGNGVIVHMLLIGSAFDGWHGLFTQHPFLGPMLVSIAVCLTWIGLSLAISSRIIRRRDFPARSEPGRTGWATPVRAVVLTVALVAVLALGAGLGPSAVTAYRVSAAVGPEFDHVTLLQQSLIGRHAPPSARLDVLPKCNRRGAADIGPGDWNCNIFVYLSAGLEVPRAAPRHPDPTGWGARVHHNFT